MSRERFQSETGQTIDDNACIFFANSSPLFYTVNPRSGVSLRQQEPLGASSILKSFRNLPGCTRLSSSLSNLDTTSGNINKRANFPLLPDINQKGSMGKSFQGHHSSSKRFARERYNPPFKVNAKIRHVYTQEVTAIEGKDQPNPPNQVSCHRQTQTELQLCSESKQRQEVEQINKGNELMSKEKEVEEEVVEKNEKSKSQNVELTLNGAEKTNDKRKVDASTSPIPSPYFPLTSEAETTTSPFSGCSQMSVYPPLNYVRKLEDLEKITGHIVIQRFFTRTDDVFGSWLEKQLGMTSKSVSVDTSEFENAKTAEIQDEEENTTNDNDEGANASGLDEIQLAVGVIQEGEELLQEGQEETVNGAINKEEGEGGLQEAENMRQSDTVDDKENADCALADPIKCECYLDEIGSTDGASDNIKEIEEQIITEDSIVVNSKPDDGEDVVIGEQDNDEVETLISARNKETGNLANNVKNLKNEEDIDEMVRCTLEAYLLAPMAYEEINEEEQERQEKIEDAASPAFSTVKSEVDSGRADSIRSQDRGGSEGQDEIEGNTSHDSVETVYEIAMAPLKSSTEVINASDDTKLENDSVRILQRSLSADSCIGTESSGDAKNPATNASQSSNDTIEGVGDPTIATTEIDQGVDSPASAPPTMTKLPSINASLKAMQIARKMGTSAVTHRSITPCSATGVMRITPRRNNGKTENAESEDADGESETESEITDNLMANAKSGKHHDGTDLELEEVEEYEGDDDDDRDAFDAMVANHLKYSRGFSTGTNRRSRLNRGTQTTKSIEPSTTSGSLSPSSSSNSSFDVEIVSKSKRITTSSSTGGGGTNSHDQHGLITPSNMTLAWHEGGRRRSYLPSSSSSLNLLNMKFSLGRDFESEVSIRMPTNKSSANTNMSSATMLLSGSGEPGGKTLMSSTTRSHHHNSYQSRGLSPARHHSLSQQQIHSHNPEQPPLVSPASATTQPTSEPTELQSLWKDVRTKLDVQVDEMSTTIPEEEQRPNSEGLQVRGNGILQLEPGSGPTTVKFRRNEDKIKRSLQRLKKILDD